MPLTAPEIYQQSGTVSTQYLWSKWSTLNWYIRRIRSIPVSSWPSTIPHTSTVHADIPIVSQTILGKVSWRKRASWYVLNNYIDSWATLKISFLAVRQSYVCPQHLCGFGNRMLSCLLLQNKEAHLSLRKVEMNNAPFSTNLLKRSSICAGVPRWFYLNLPTSL